MKAGTILDLRKKHTQKSLILAKLKELGYEKAVLKHTLADIYDADEDIRDAIMVYVRDGVVTNLCQKPFEVEKMIDTYHMNPIAAMLFMDWYRKEPKKALQCILLGVDEIRDIEDDAEMEELDVEIPKDVQEMFEDLEESDTEE